MFPKLQPKQLYSATAIAKILEITRRTVWRHVAKGYLQPPAVRLSARSVRWTASQLHRYLRGLGLSDCP